MKKVLVVAVLAVLVFVTAASAQNKVVVIPLSQKHPKSPVPETGQTTSYYTKDDGALQKGVSWPEPRFVDNNDGTVTDRLTGLIWLQETHCTRYFPLDPSGPYARPWESAVAACNLLRNGYCGLSDGSQFGDWRMPNIKELLSLIDFSQTVPALPPSFPRSASASIYSLDTVWSSTTYNYSTGTPQGDAWHLDFYNGAIDHKDKESINGIWPVRGGKE